MGLAEVIKGSDLLDLLADLRTSPRSFAEFCDGQSRSDAIHLDAGGAELRSQHFGKYDHPVLGDTGIAQPGETRIPPLSNVDDAPLFFCRKTAAAFWAQGK